MYHRLACCDSPLFRSLSIIALLVVAGCDIPLIVIPPVPIDPAPIVEPGNRMLIVYESEDVDTYPKEQAVILSATRLRKYLNERCVKDGSGQPEYRILDQHTEFTGGDDGVWPAAMKLERKSLPWIIVSTGKRGASVPLPSTTDETIELCRKYFEESAK